MNNKEMDKRIRERKGVIMNFKLTEEQELIRQNMRDFAKTYVDPIAAEIDENSRYPEEVFKRLGEMGWMGMPFPAEYGGGGIEYTTYSMAIEELSRSCAATGFTLQVHVMGTTPIFLYGTDEQKKKFDAPLCKGGGLSCFSVTEPGAGTDMGAATTTADKVGNEYVLNGTKTFASNGPNAETYVIFALTDKSAGPKGMSAFIVPRGTPGLKVGGHFMKMGLRASQTSELILKDCRIPQENLLGAEGEGTKIAMASFDHGRIAIAAQSVGIAQAALDESISYSKQRIQFNKPISRNQAIQWMIADMATEVQAGRFMYLYAAWLKDQGLPFSKEASMAKLWCAEMCNRHTSKAVQIHGGYGYCKGFKVERLMRDAKITEIYEGTSEAQRMIVANSILR